MSAPSQTSFNSSTGNGVTTVFPYTFKILQASDLQVIVDGVVKTLTTHYTVSGAGVDGGGDVTFLTAPASGAVVVRRRNMVFERVDTDYQYQGDLPAEVLNADQDAPILMLQQLEEQVERGVRGPAGESWSELPAAADRLDLMLAFNATTGQPELSSITQTQLANAVAAAYVGGSTADGVAFLPAGTGAVATTVQAKLRESVSVNDYGASRNASGSANYTAIMAAIAANPGKVIVLPDSFYTVSSPIVIDTDSTKLKSPGTTINYTGPDGTDAITFRCTSTATTSSFVNGNGIDGITIYSPTARTSGVGLRLTQCNLFEMGFVRVDNFYGGMLVEGGQLFGGDTFVTFMSPTLYPSVVSGSYQLKFKTAPIDGGLHQTAFTWTLDKMISGGNYSAEYGVVFESADGITIASGYISGSYQSLVLIKPGVSGKSVSGVDMGNCYLDGKNMGSGTLNGIEILDDGFASASLVNNVDFSSLLTVGNLQGKGIYSTHPNIQDVWVDPGRFINVAGTEVDVTSGDISQDSWIGIWLPWTPTLTFATPGNLSVSYSSRLGRFIRDSAGLVHITFSVVTSAFTHTTASGALWLTGVPVGTPSSLGVRLYSDLQFNGITKAGYTNFSCEIGSGSTAILFFASGSAVGLSDVTAADCPTGGTMILRGSLSFPAAELG